MNHIQKGNRTRTTPGSGGASVNKNSNRSICQNPSCGTVVPTYVVFCQFCSCYICGRFDENKDPSLWMVCEPDSPQDQCCGLTCHIECAFKAENLGVTSGKFQRLDANYWCSCCGKVSEILGCWKKQLSIAKDALRVDVLCHRISLSYRLMDGTSRFDALHEIVTGAKSKLEEELGPINQCSFKIDKVSMLHVARDVQKLCADAITMADLWMSHQSYWTPDPSLRVGANPVCRFRFEEISSSSVVIHLIDVSPPAVMHSIKRYDIWCSRCRLEGYQSLPTMTFSALNKRVKISHLQPSTLYAFKIMSFTDEGPYGISEARCLMKKPDIIPNKPNNIPRPGRKSRRIILRSAIEATAPTVHPEQTCNNEGILSPCIEEQGCDLPERTTELQSVDLNADPIPDLNEDPTLPVEPPREEDNIQMEPTVEVYCNNASESLQEKAQEADPAEKLPRLDKGKASASNTESDQDFVKKAQEADPAEKLPRFDKGKAPASNTKSDQGFVKMICTLQKEGHIPHEFRVKFLTWFSFNSTEHDRRVVSSYFEVLYDDPQSLGEQLIDSFSDIVGFMP